MGALTSIPLSISTPVTIHFSVTAGLQVHSFYSLRLVFGLIDHNCRTAGSCFSSRRLSGPSILQLLRGKLQFA